MRNAEDVRHFSVKTRSFIRLCYFIRRIRANFSERIDNSLKISAVATTDRSMQLGFALQKKINGKIDLLRCREDEISAWIHLNFADSDALIFITSVDTALRALSAFVRVSPETQPAVVVLDELGNYVIPILSGGHGKADELANVLSQIIGATPIITSAVDADKEFSVESWARSVGLRIANPEAAKGVTQKLLSGHTVYYDSIFPIPGSTPKGIEPAAEGAESDFSVTYLASVPEKALHLVPPVLTLGISFPPETPCEELCAAFFEFMHECGCHALALREVCTAEKNAHEQGLIDFCTKIGLPFRAFSEIALSVVIGRFSPPDSGGKVHDPDNFSERSAVFGSGGGTLFVRKMSVGAISMALAIKEPR